MCTAMAVIVRPARRADLAAFYGAGWPTLKANVMEIDGRIVAVGGIARRNGRRVAFFDLDEEGRRHPIAIGRAARRFLQAEAVCCNGRPVFAEADRAEPGAVRWLTSLGFRPLAGQEGVFRWQG